MKRRIIHTAGDADLFKSNSGKTYGVSWKGAIPHFVIEALGINGSKYSVSSLGGMAWGLSEENARVLYLVVYRVVAQ